MLKTISSFKEVELTNDVKTLILCDIDGTILHFPDCDNFSKEFIKEISPQIILFMAGERIKTTMKNFEDLNHSKFSFLNRFFVGKIFYRFIVEKIDPFWDKAQHVFFTIIKGKKKVIEEKLIKKAIALKKKQIKKTQVIDEIPSEDDEPVIKPKPVAVAPVAPSKPSIKFV